MDIVMWVLAGAVLGWIGFTYLEQNQDRGMLISTIIGAFGGYVGGKLLSPMFGAAAVPGAFNTSAMLFAVGAAVAFIMAGTLIHKRFGL
jgi:uncharacterized membrane protein YeaQ/YmgE (transglycosylase-associated protein family)